PFEARLRGGGPTIRRVRASLPVVEVAGDVVVRSERDQRGRGIGAARHDVRAPRAEAAARGWVERVRRIAGDGWRLEPSQRILGRRRGDERLRVRVLWRLGERVPRADLDDLAVVTPQPAASHALR